MYNVGDRIVIKDPSGQFYVIGEVGHIVEFAPPIAGMNPIRLLYIVSFNEEHNQQTDPSVVDFEYYDVIDSYSELIVTDEDMLKEIDEAGFE